MPAEQFRRDRITSLADFTSGVGLEIGPLDRPIALRSDYDVRYVDVIDTPGLREYYRGDPGVAVDEIVELDFALTDEHGQIHSTAEAVAADAPYQWLVASHVVEHIPDLIGWLADLASVVADDGVVVLAVPDQRYTFDLYRAPTTVGQLLQAHDLNDKVPSVRAVYDHFRTAITVPPAQLWAGDRPGLEARQFDLEGTLGVVTRVREKGDYIDCHVWIFTPGSFVDQIVELGELGLCDFVIEKVIDTAFNELEFYVSLRRLPRNIDQDTDRRLRAEAVRSYTDTPTPTPAATEAESLAATAPSAAQSPAEPPLPPGAHPFVVSSSELRLIRAKRSALEAARRLLKRR